MSERRVIRNIPAHQVSAQGDLRPACRERGASTIEYVAMTVLTGILVLALIAVPAAPQLRGAISDLICEITSYLPGGGGGECGGDLLTEEDFQTRCTISSTSQNAGSTVDIAWVSLGGDAGLSWKEYSDGEFHVTIMDGYSAGANVNTGVTWGKNVTVGGASANAGIELGYGNGDTWVFDDREEAQAFVDDMQGYVDSNWNYVPVLGPIFNSPPEPPGEPNVTHHQFSLEGDVGGNASLRPGFQSDEDEDGNRQHSGSFSHDWLPSISGSASLNGNVNVATTHGEDPADTTRAYTFTGNFSAQAGGGVYEWDFDPQYQVEESFTVVEDANGEIIGLTFTAGTVTGTSGDYTSEVYSTSIDIESDAQREVVMDWMSDPVGGLPAGVLPNAQGITEPPEDLSGSAQYYPTPDGSQSLNPLEQLMYERGVTTHDVHSGVSEDGGFGFRAKILGVGGGYGRNLGSSEETLEESNYLAPPDYPGGSREFQPNPNC
ncbi:hypothetical protein [Nesterenkonia massiliensis]|uniref:hypothetical protein n=1 Tax=Nesterenkonia massiliensis TaxID=1232429 RepID=UPI00041FA214|nr:hypothetical protein [Nesterenkonia massiliensis]